MNACNGTCVSWLGDDEDIELDLIADNAVEIQQAPYPAIAPEMPGVQLEREQLVTAVEDPLAPSEEEAIDAAADNANFGPQDVPIVQPDADEVGPTGDVVYNVIVDMPHAVPTATDEV